MKELGRACLIGSTGGARKRESLEGRVCCWHMRWRCFEEKSLSQGSEVDVRNSILFFVPVIEHSDWRVVTIGEVVAAAGRALLGPALQVMKCWIPTPPALVDVVGTVPAESARSLRAGIESHLHSRLVCQPPTRLSS